MHANKVKRRSCSAVEVTSTSVGCVAVSTTTADVRTVAASSVLSSCNPAQYDNDICICWSKLQSDSCCTDHHYRHLWSNERRKVNYQCGQWYNDDGQQETIKKLSRSGSEENSDVTEYNHCSQLCKDLLVKKNEGPLLTTAGSSEDCSLAKKEEASCCYSSSRERIVYQSCHDLKRISTRHCNTASSSLSSSVPFRNLPTHYYRRYQQRSRCILYANLKLFIYWQAFSLLATGLCVHATAVGESFLNFSDMKHKEGNVVPEDTMPWKQLSKNLASATTADETRSNPFLRYHRSTSERLGLALDSVCYIWSSIAPNDLCKLAPWARYQFLRKISIFSRDCLEENNIKAAQLFRLTPRYVRSEADLQMQAKFLRANSDGQDCILAPAGAQQCLSCFQKIDRALKKVDEAYENFNVMLHRFDCMLAVDAASATRPFSPNGSCTDCKIWYRKWLVVHSLNLWIVPPCINWCYYVQLACPHLATSKVVDYAGHPSFQCRDLHIPSSVDVSQDLFLKPTENSGVALKCACLHPCDLEEFYNLVDTTPSAEQNGPDIYSGTIVMTNNEEEDFFPSPQHCVIRRHMCCNVMSEAKGQHRVMMRRSLTTTDALAPREKWRNFKLDDNTLTSFVISFARVFMRSPDSTGAVPHHQQDSAIQKTFTAPAGYAFRWWWTKYRARQRLRSDAKTVATININNVPSTTAPITVDSIVVTAAPTAVISSAAAGWRGTKRSVCSGISIYTLYTLFICLLLLRRPPLL